MSALVDDLLRLLRACPAVRHAKVINYDETPQGKLEIKIRCRLVQEYQFQVWIHAEPQFLDYAYQLFSVRPLLRWDNAPHYPSISTMPHHFHDETEQVTASPLSGDPRSDLPLVLASITDWLESRRTKRD